MIGTILLSLLLLVMGFSIGFPLGAEWRKNELTSKIPRRFYHKDRWYEIFYGEEYDVENIANQLKTWEGDKK